MRPAVFIHFFIAFRKFSFSTQDREAFESVVRMRAHVLSNAPSILLPHTPTYKPPGGCRAATDDVTMSTDLSRVMITYRAINPAQALALVSSDWQYDIISEAVDWHEADRCRLYCHME